MLDDEQKLADEIDRLMHELTVTHRRRPSTRRMAT
jgi:hypothetical protein